MKKQEAIKEAYGVHWGSVKDYIDENGWIRIYKREDRFDEIEDDIEIEDKFDYGIESCLIRPKSLQGIEDNNGWIKTENQNDLPLNSIECYFKIKKDNDIQIGIFVVHINIFVGVDSDYAPFEISYYKPIEQPKPPIY